MSRLSTFAAWLLVALWLPATLHCDLEAADVHFLTHDDHHSPTDHGTGTGSDYHVLKDTAFTASTPSLKVPLPSGSLAVVPAAVFCDCDGWAEPVLSPARQPPPPALKVAWQFITRAAPPARAPALHA